MKTRKLLFTMIAAMTMMFGLTLTAHAEETAPAPATKVVGVEGIGTFTIPADWSDAMYIDNYGTFWFNPAKTAYVVMGATKSFDNGLAPIETYAAILKNNIEANGTTVLDWQVTKYFGHDAVYGITLGTADDTFPTDYPALHDATFECTYDYYAGNRILGTCAGAISVEELQPALAVLATYKPAQ